MIPSDGDILCLSLFSALSLIILAFATSFFGSFRVLFDPKTQNLFSRLATMGQFTELHAAAVIATLVNTVHFLHSKGIVHRDLKPANLLLKGTAESSTLVIVDFGASYIMDAPDGYEVAPGSPIEEMQQRPIPSTTAWQEIGVPSSTDLQRRSMRTVTGTPFYLAPEIVVGQDYSAAVDREFFALSVEAKLSDP